MRKLIQAIYVLVFTLVLTGPTREVQAAEGKVKVFILAGQSNMEGHGQLRSLNHLGTDPKYGHLLKALKNADGSWAVRDDVSISYRAEHREKKHGPLSVGWGCEEHEIGPELMFGTIMGERLEEHVLLIKTAWGGKSVWCDFRSPGAGPMTWDEQYKKGIKDTEENHLPTTEINDEYLNRGGHWYCHYNGSAANYALIGYALAEALSTKTR